MVHVGKVDPDKRHRRVDRLLCMRITRRCRAAPNEMALVLYSDLYRLNFAMAARQRFNSLCNSGACAATDSLSSSIRVSAPHAPPDSKKRRGSGPKIRSMSFFERAADQRRVRHSFL